MTDDTKVKALARIVAGLARELHNVAAVLDLPLTAQAVRVHEEQARALGDAPDGAQWLEVPAPQSEAHVQTPPRAMLGYSQFSHLAGVETATRGTPVSSPPPGPASSDGDTGEAVWGVYGQRGLLFASEMDADEASRYTTAFDASRPAGAPHYAVHLVSASRLEAAEREREEERAIRNSLARLLLREKAERDAAIEQHTAVCTLGLNRLTTELHAEQDRATQLRAELARREVAASENLVLHATLKDARAEIAHVTKERDGALRAQGIDSSTVRAVAAAAYGAAMPLAWQAMLPQVVANLKADLARVTEQRNEAQDQYLAEQARADALQRRIEGGTHGR